MCNFSCKLFVYVAKIIYFCSRNKNQSEMKLMNSYFYGYYFYFTEHCEAVGRM